MVSARMRDRRFNFFFPAVPRSARILEVGSGDGWLGRRLRAEGWTNYTGLDLHPPADIVGDVREWERVGLAARSFDVIVAFEVVEHLDCWDALAALLKDDGVCLVTTPVPYMDWACRLLEVLGINQQRTSPHSNLVYLRRVPQFEVVRLRTVAGIGQWAVMQRARVPADRMSAAAAEAPR
jgi:hypothetical protein